VALVVAFACSCSGRDAAGPTPTPVLTPVANPVSLRPEQVILPDAQFPLAGYTVDEDKQAGSDAWERRWTDPGTLLPFSWVSVGVRVLAPSAPSAGVVAQNVCDATFTPTSPRSMGEITVPTVGDAARACRYDWDQNPGGVLVYKTGVRNVAIEVSVGRTDTSTTSVAEAIAFSASLADYQLWIVEKVAPLPDVPLRPAPQVEVPSERVQP
jgi:hypothetical protein